MQTELNSKFLELIREGKSILSDYPTKKQIKEGLEHYKKIGKSTPLEAFVKNAKNEFLGDILHIGVSEIFDLPKKYTKRLKNIPQKQERYQVAQEKERMKQWMESEYQRNLTILNNRYSEWDKRLKDFLAKVSIIDNGEVIVTSKQLLQGVRNAGKYHKSETKIKHIISFLEDYSHYIVVPIEEVKDYSIGRISEKIRDLEEVIRTFISTELGKIYGGDWWVKGIPPDVKKNAEEKREKAIRSGTEDINVSLIQFIDFSDLSKILDRRDNRKVFGDKLKPIEAFIMKLKELEPIRNKLFHSRELSKKDLDKLNLYTQEFLDKIKS